MTTPLEKLNAQIADGERIVASCHQRGDACGNWERHLAWLKRRRDRLEKDAAAEIEQRTLDRENREVVRSGWTDRRYRR